MAVEKWLSVTRPDYPRTRIDFMYCCLVSATYWSIEIVHHGGWIVRVVESVRVTKFWVDGVSVSCYHLPMKIFSHTDCPWIRVWLEWLKPSFRCARQCWMVCLAKCWIDGVSACLQDYLWIRVHQLFFVFLVFLRANYPWQLTDCPCDVLMWILLKC